MGNSAELSDTTPLSPKSLRGRVLVVDDYQPVREIVRTFLEGRGFEVSEAVDGLDAIGKAGALSPNLVVLDLAMPGMNGVEVASVLHQNLPNVPIVALTMYEQFFEPVLASAVGVSAVVSKGDGLSKLVECVESLIFSAQRDPDRSAPPAD
jgi:CheY-like chemotaxis protein